MPAFIHGWSKEGVKLRKSKQKSATSLSRKMLTIKLFIYIIKFSASEVLSFAMKIDIGTLKDAPGKDFTYNFTVAEAALSWDEEELQVTAPLEVQLQAAYRDRKVEVTGSLRTRVILTCSRCLKLFSFSLNEDFTDEIPVDDETTLDLSELVRDIFLTALPFKPLCQATCQGICPTCGVDLNEKQCGCPVDNMDPRLSVLKKLLDK